MKLDHGNHIKVLSLYSIVTAVVWSFLDNVTTVLLLTPMLLYIARVMELDPVPYLLSEIFASNIGGAATLIGDPPNIMIGSAAKLSFNDFLINMGPVVLVDFVVVLLVLVIVFRKRMQVEGAEQERIVQTIEALDERAAITDILFFAKSIVTIHLVVFLSFAMQLWAIYAR